MDRLDSLVLRPPMRPGGPRPRRRVAPSTSNGRSAVDEPPGRVLVVEDDELLASVFAKRIRHAGHAATIAAHGAAALEELAVARYDLVLLDLSLPHVHGLQVLAEVTSRPDSPPVVVLTGGDASLIALARRGGARRVLRKPLLPFHLVRLVHEILDQGRRER